MPKVIINDKKGLVIKQGSGFEIQTFPKLTVNTIQGTSGTLSPGVNLISPSGSGQDHPAAPLTMVFPTASSHPGQLFVVRVSTGSVSVALSASNAGTHHNSIYVMSGVAVSSHRREGTGDDEAGANGSRFNFLASSDEDANSGFKNKTATFLCDGYNYCVLTVSGGYSLSGSANPQ